MQFHMNGFSPGDPDLATPTAAGLAGVDQERIPQSCDVVIVGCGPAGLTLAAQLSVFPDVHALIVDQRPGPLQVGQADGLMCRTLEMMQAFGIREKIERESYGINEVAFWKPDVTDPRRITRQGRIDDVAEDLSECPHVILNQARVQDRYLELMRNSANRMEPYYGRRFVSHVRGPESDSHPVTVTVETTRADGTTTIETIKTRYLVGCDGARSGVRQAMGRVLRGDSANQAWGVMDILAVTSFPDVRLKCLIQSADEGSIVLIPREGGFMFRVYVELDKLNKDERVASRNLTIEQLIAAAQRIFHPYTLDVKEVAWWSVYEIGQRLTDKFDDVDTDGELPRVFIAGDACHTHSPKAGQGMNVSMQDAFNLGWKLAAVLRGQSPPPLLATYSAERQAIAKGLIDFDREWSSMLATPVKSADNPNGIEPAEVQRYFIRQGEYTAGTSTHYKAGLLTGPTTHQVLATGLTIGKRFHSAPVVRLADALPIQLGWSAKADGRWRLYLFADPTVAGKPSSRMTALSAYLDSARSPVRRALKPGQDLDAVIDVRAVFQDYHRDLSMDVMPPVLFPPKGRHGLRDYEKLFTADKRSAAAVDIFEARGIDRRQGCIVVVRPDQYVTHILPLDAHAELAAYFAPILMTHT